MTSPAGNTTPEQDAEAILDWTTARLAAGPDAAARDALAAAVARMPGHAALAAQYADALRLDAQLAAAATEYHRALSLDPSLPEAWAGLGAAELASFVRVIQSRFDMSLRRLLQTQGHDDS